MKFVANILTNRIFNDDSELYNVVSTKKELIEGIPTLVIGWEYTKKLYPNANILNWEIGDDIFWTFGNRERRQRYEETLIKFRKYAINKFVKSIRYKFISFINDDGYNAIRIILSNKINSNIYIYNDMIYITDIIGKVVYGFSLKEYDYIGMDRKELLKDIFTSKNNIIDTKDTLSLEIKIALKNHNYVIPCLY
jgi:hypothetical protein